MRNSIIHHFKSNIHVAEMSCDIVGGFNVAAAQLASPDYVIPGVERQGNIETVAL